MKKLKILLVSPFPPPFGGIASYAQDIWDSEELNNKFKLYRLNTSRRESSISGKGRTDNSWSHWKLFLQPKNWGYSFFVLFNFVEFIFKCLRIKPNVIHVHTCGYFGFIRSGIFLFLAKPFKARRILHLHNPIDVFFEDNRQNRLSRSLILWSINQADELVALSYGLKKWVRINLHRDAHVILNACNVDQYKMRNREALNRAFPIVKQKIVVLMIGGIHRHKGVYDLLQVVSELNPEDKARLVFILPGRGDKEKADLFIRENILENIVLLPGVVSDELKTILLCGSDIFILPSYAEGQPIAIIEAMAASLPVISTYIGSIPEIVENNVSGLLFQSGDKGKLQEYILKLADNSELRRTMGQEGRKRAVANHTMEILFDSISKLYQA